MSHGWDPVAQKRSAGHELEDHYRSARSQEQDERSRRVSEGMRKKSSLWRRLLRKKS